MSVVTIDQSEVQLQSIYWRSFIVVFTDLLNFIITINAIKVPTLLNKLSYAIKIIIFIIFKYGTSMFSSCALIDYGRASCVSSSDDKSLPMINRVTNPFEMGSFF